MWKLGRSINRKLDIQKKIEIHSTDTLSGTKVEQKQDRYDNKDRQDES